jgi:hypothetical protein
VKQVFLVRYLLTRRVTYLVWIVTICGIKDSYIGLFSSYKRGIMEGNAESLRRPVVILEILCVGCGCRCFYGILGIFMVSFRYSEIVLYRLY